MFLDQETDSRIWIYLKAHGGPKVSVIHGKLWRLYVKILNDALLKETPSDVENFEPRRRMSRMIS